MSEVELKFTPKKGQMFYYITRKLTVHEDWLNFDNPKPHEYIESGNCFETPEEAEVMLEKVKKLFAMQFVAQITSSPVEEENDAPMEDD